MAVTDSSFNAKGNTITAFETIDDASRDFGVKVHSNHICGVYGESMANLPLVGEREAAVTPRTGVFGRGDVNGVEGLSDKIGVSGQSLGGSTVVSGIGVLGSSDRNRAGVFMGRGGSLNDPDVDETLRSTESGPGKHPAQLRLVPHDDFPHNTTLLPSNGLVGDFFAVLKPPDGNNNRQAVLWFCIQSHDQPKPGDDAQWWQIAFMGPITPGGKPAI